LTYSSKNENRSYKYYPLFNTLTLEKKIEDLEAKIKRRTYAGRVTKKQRKLNRIYERFMSTAASLKKIDGV